ncbi:RNA polymerase sigma factor [Fimbriiglobus ruber]|uniref:High-affnity carbon uptake protein Hat/HatR n=1 Tax=Fimbriiglobus ruber TaxID=1908690 RepID=A0A225DFZ3_9BACT|nr:RNA polymerase sigma factor [Fimbriiglobus ruber]OWK35007.1 High-affnity carbon uptake protein Hat/HatR [Fimbriiglobus ruber]
MHAPLTRLASHIAPPLSDGDLLARFVRDRDEIAFATLVHRHGSTVFGVCRRVLGDTDDADDAFQAVFLVLVNRADALTDRLALGGWLHGVALRVAKKARTTFARRRKHERRTAEARAESVFDPPPDDPPAWLDRELAALPERFREPVVRCLIQNQPRSEVAAELGIPVGTLASRLDTARKRLAKRLAPYRVPLVFGGLLVPVPATLAETTVCRAADAGTVGVIHQLANEVTKTMIPNTKWVVAVVVGALTAVGGLLLTVVASDPQDTRQPIPIPRPKDAKESPEPAWAKAFRKAYELKDGEYVKRVAPPYIDERKEYMYRVWYPNKQTPEEEERARDHLDREKLFLALFLDFDGNKLTRRTAVSATWLARVPTLQNGEKMMNVWDAVTCITGRRPPEVVIDPKSSDHPLLSTKEQLVESALVRGVLSVGGDFVTRKDAPLDKLAPQLEKILRDECDLDVRLTVREEEQEVYVVGGTFHLTPRSWRKKDEIDLYADEGVLGKHFNRTNTQNPETGGVVSGWNVRRPATLVRHVGEFVNARMVWDRELPIDPKFNVYQHERSPRTATQEQKAADHDPEKVLANVTEQTGLTFKKAKRKVQVLYLSVPEKK